MDLDRLNEPVEQRNVDGNKVSLERRNGQEEDRKKADRWEWGRSHGNRGILRALITDQRVCDGTRRDWTLPSKIRLYLMYLLVARQFINLKPRRLARAGVAMTLPRRTLSLASSSTCALNSNQLILLFSHNSIARHTQGCKSHAKPKTSPCADIVAIHR